MKKVAILMSTFNGEKYLSEQIDSIINQSYTNWILYIRDDGSTDKTRKIIEKYVIKDPRIRFVESTMNLGPAVSFLYLMDCINADYYFFCDQDDYWLKDKLQVMISNFEICDNSIPQVLYCNLKCVNEKLIPEKYNFDNLIGKISGISRFIGNDMPGCVMAFNRATRDLEKRFHANRKYIAMHDWWVALIAQTFGQVHFIDQRLVYYRQHGNNVLGAGKKGNNIRKLFQKDLIKKQKYLVYESYTQDLLFKNTFKEILPPIIKRMLEELAYCKSKSFFYRIRFINKYDFKLLSKIRTWAYKYIFVFKLKKILKIEEKKIK